MKIYKKQINKKGFTIIETMVAVFILSIAIVALLGLTAQSLFTARYARNEITANYLAQEAADYIRNRRDTVAFLSDTGNNWNGFLAEFGKGSVNTKCFTSDGCYFGVNDITTTPVTSCPSEGCPLLKYKEDSSSSFYYYATTGSNSIFKRKIEMWTNSTNSDEVFVRITINWNNGNILKSKVLNFSLLNWYDF